MHSHSTNDHCSLRTSHNSFIYLLTLFFYLKRTTVLQYLSSEFVFRQHEWAIACQQAHHSVTTTLHNREGIKYLILVKVTTSNKYDQGYLDVLNNHLYPVESFLAWFLLQWAWAQRFSLQNMLQILKHETTQDCLRVQRPSMVYPLFLASGI